MSYCPDCKQDIRIGGPAHTCPESRQRKALGPSDATACSGVVGHWTPVAEEMPDDEITVLVWCDDDATLAFHDSDVREQRGDSGWIAVAAGGGFGSSRVLLNVTHWCRNIHPPNVNVLAFAGEKTPNH